MNLIKLLFSVESNTMDLFIIYIMYQSNRSLNIPPGIPGAFDFFSCPGGRGFDELSLPGGGEFDHYS